MEALTTTTTTKLKKKKKKKEKADPAVEYNNFHHRAFY
jgi:hypothetical protein